MATIQDIAKHAGVSPSTVSRILRGKPPFSEDTRQRVLEAAAAVKYRDQTDAPAAPTIRDVAARAGVSISTVSNVLNNYPVGEENRQKVLLAVQELHYEPNIMGRGLRKEREYRVIAAVSNPHYRALQGIYTAAEELGCDVVLMHSGINRKEDFSRRLDNGLASGILFFDFFDEAVVSEFGERYNVVQCGGCTDAPNVHSVSNDYESAGYQLTKILLELGRRRVFMITGQSARGEPVSFLKKYELGFRRAMSEAGLPIGPQTVQSWGRDIFLSFDYQRQERFVERLLEGNRAQWPDAIIAPTGQGASLLVQALRNHGLRVPEDVAVAAFLSAENHRETVPYVTAMQQDWYAAGYEALKLLAEVIKSGKREPKRIVMPYTILLCGSTHRELYPFEERALCVAEE